MAEVLGNPKGTAFFNSWNELNNYINNEMTNYSAQFFVAKWKAFDGEDIYGNNVQGFLMRILTDNYLLFGVSIDGRLVFRHGSASGWDEPKIII